MPKLVTSSVERKNLRWDAKRKKYVGWQIDVYVNQGAGKRPKRHRVTYSSETEAKAAESRLRVKSENIRLGIETPEETKRVKIIDLLNKRLAEIESRREKIRAERVFQLFIDVNPEIKFVDELRHNHFDAFIEHRLSDAARGTDKKIKPETVGRELTPLVTAFRKGARGFKELADFRLPAIERPRVKKRPRQTNITEAQKNAIIKAILSDRLKKERTERTRNRPAIAAMFEVAWYLGLRLGEIIKLEKADFNFENKTLRVVRWKTGAVSLLEFLPERIVEILQKQSEDSKSAFLFNLACSEHTLNSIIKQACETCGLKHGIKEPDGITFHSNRHSFTSRIVQVADIATAQSFTSHSNAEMVAYYSHASPDSKRAAMEKMYGKKEVLTPEGLRELYEKTKTGELEFEDFTRAFFEVLAKYSPS